MAVIGQYKCEIQLNPGPNTLSYRIVVDGYHLGSTDSGSNTEQDWQHTYDWNVGAASTPESHILRQTDQDLSASNPILSAADPVDALFFLPDIGANVLEVTLTPYDAINGAQGSGVAGDPQTLYLGNPASSSVMRAENVSGDNIVAPTMKGTGGITMTFANSVIEVDGSGAGGATTLAALTDTTINSPADGEFLRYNSVGSDWLNTLLVAGDIPSLDAAKITAGTFADALIAASNVTQHVGAIDHDSLLNYVAGQHVLHSGVSITGNSGLTGGGDITTSRTISVKYTSGSNLIDSATDSGDVVAADYILYQDLDTGDVRKDTVGALPFTNNVGDITRVNITAGNGLSGTTVDTTSGDHTQTLTVGVGDGITVSATAVGLDIDGLDDVTLETAPDDKLLGADQLVFSRGSGLFKSQANDIPLGSFLNDQNWTANAIEDSGVGTNEYTSTTQRLGIKYDGTTNFINARRTLSETGGADLTKDLVGTAISGSDYILYHDFDDAAGGVKVGEVSDLPFLASGDAVETLTSVTNGGISVGGTATDVTLDLNIVDLSLTATSPTGLDSLPFHLDGGDSRRILFEDINLGAFNDDLGYTNVTASLGVKRVSNDIQVEYTAGANSLYGASPSGTGVGTLQTTDRILFADDSDSFNVKHAELSQLPFTNNAGTVTEVTVGTGLDVTSGTTTPNITLDLDEIGVGGTLVAGDHLVAVNGTATQKQLISAIPLGIFSNNLGWTSNAGTVTQVDGTGTVSGLTLTGSVTSSGSLTLGGTLSVLEGDIVDGSILARLAADETVSGQWTFTDNVNIEAAVPRLYFKETGGPPPVDEKLYRMVVSNSDFFFQTRTDADGAGVNIFQVVRGTGTAVTGIDFATNIRPNATSTRDLGTTSLRWANAYVDTLTLTNALAYNMGGTGLSDSPGNDELLVSLGPGNGWEGSGSGLTWNGTTLNATNFSGVGSGLTGVVSDSSTVTDLTTETATYYPIMADGTSGAISHFVDASEFSYTATTDTLNVVSLAASSDVTLGTNADLVFSGGSTSVLIHTNQSTRDKIRVWSTSFYAIGMQNSFTFGPLGTNYAMTFQMNDDANRGFWWGHDNHTLSGGAMALSTDGYLTLARHMRLGYGEADTTAPTSTRVLDISMASGATTAIDINGLTTGDNILDWGGTGYTRMKKITDQGGFSIGCDSSMVILAGDTTDAYVTGRGIVGATTIENLHLAADANVYIAPNQQLAYTTAQQWVFSITGQVRPYYDGASATPTYAFGNDTDTGMRLAATGVLRLSAESDDVFIDVDAPNNYIFMNRHAFISEARDELLRMRQTSATGNPYLSWYQSNTRRMYMMYSDNGRSYLVNENSGAFEVQTAADEILTLRVSNTTGKPYITLANQDGAKAYWQGEDDGTTYLGTALADAPIHIRDFGRSFNMATFDYNGTDTVTFNSNSDAVLALNTTSATGQPLVRFKQNGTDKARVQYINGGQMRFRLEGNTDDFSFYAGGAVVATDRRLNFNGLGNDLGRWGVENSQFYVEEYQTVLTVAATVTCDWDRSNQLHLTITNTVTDIAIDDDSMQPGGSYILMVQEGSSAPPSVNWNATNVIFWANGTEPVLNAGDLNDITVVQFFKTTAGSNTRIIGSWFLAQ